MRAHKNGCETSNKINIICSNDGPRRTQKHHRQLHSKHTASNNNQEQDTMQTARKCLWIHSVRWHSAHTHRMSLVGARLNGYTIANYCRKWHSECMLGASVWWMVSDSGTIYTWSECLNVSYVYCSCIWISARKLNSFKQRHTIMLILPTERNLFDMKRVATISNGFVYNVPYDGSRVFISHIVL